MRRLALLLLAVLASLALAAPPDAQGRGKRASRAKKKAQRHDAPGTIEIDGVTLPVRWTDGDSFKFVDGLQRGRGTRLLGYNSLEAFGPVHQWGAWTPAELYAIARASAGLAASRTWRCTTAGKADGYGRLLVSCPDLAVEMARQGHGLAYAVEGTRPAPEVLAAQAEAMRERRGMWAKGTTGAVVTSVHSVGETGPDGEKASNRVVDTKTGMALKRAHANRYATCEQVCEGEGADRSCMVYVPFKRRYRGQPDCLKVTGADEAAGEDTAP